MKAEEFRIGNLLHDRENRLCRVEELSCREGEREVYAPAVNGPTTALPNKTIPLTEEWLLKFGFRERYKSHISVVYEIEEAPEINIRFKLFNETCNFRHYGTYIRKIKYVHQLQNLYFALTGEELQIKN